MSNIKNNHVSALTIGSTTIPAGGVAKVPDWEVQQSSHAIKAWLAAGVIEETNKKEKAPAIPTVPPAAVIPGLPGTIPPAIPNGDQDVDPELAEKQDIIAKLAAKGVTKTTKSKLENLRAALAALESDEADEE